MIDLAFAKVLKRFRTERGVAQDTLAGYAGLHRTYVSQLERGLKSPSLRTIQKLAHSLGVSLVEFMVAVEDELDDV